MGLQRIRHLQSGRKLQRVIFNMIDSSNLYDCKFKENKVNFRDLEEDWFSMELTNDKGDTTLVEDEFDRLGDYIVGVEIIAHEPE